MPENGLIAFCTFYENFKRDSFGEESVCRALLDKETPLHSFDFVFGKNVSVLTKLRFRCVFFFRL
jgi:hypothetical protein